ncbi:MULTISPECIES: hypothetical protein [Aeromonas]|uniref:Uncharacterized protein n=1 Tax=Aeromonas piscicola TaxID=600645 RepID=A0ABT7Q8D2_9GAMM|nr:MULTISPECIES: hypothetical protein [Aeromonas]ARW81224.1 hypothetical protein O23A_p0472 [Aeromonas salmonicida]MDM5130212.1 hypothetical protein [Aeromonas piscicola]MDM5149130.1 hypothetical protein [Aeromonas salmonicida]
MKQYQNWLAQYLICRRDNDHAMAAELAESICAFWKSRDDKTEHSKWQKVYQDHRQKTT